MGECYVPDWVVPANVRALQTTRQGGVSTAPWASFNLADHVGDDPVAVAANREALRSCLPAEPFWLTQVHGTVAVDVDRRPKNAEGDAAVARQSGRICAIMTADCLPVLFCDRAGSVAGAAHAGWRGLLAGVLESTVAGMAVPPGEVLAWLGPAIGPQNFEVGEEVRSAFVAHDPQAVHAFAPHGSGKWLCDLYRLARQRLQRIGVEAVSGGGECTFSNSGRYFSYRRDRVTGRMASLIWLADERLGV
jgi:YfiH family protein